MIFGRKIQVFSEKPITIGTSRHNCTLTDLELNPKLHFQKPVTIAADTPIEANSEI
jgi:hypothetical protein